MTGCGKSSSEFLLSLLSILSLTFLAFVGKADTDVVFTIGGMGGLYTSHRYRLKSRTVPPAETPPDPL